MVTTFLATGAAIIGFLGVMHLVYTLRTNRFEPRDAELGSRLREVSPVLTAETTMWKAWVGFNASHSLGAILFAAVYGYLAIFELSFLLSNVFLVGVSVLTLVAYLLMAHLYWFKAPFRGIAVSLFLFLAGYSLAYL